MSNGSANRNTSGAQSRSTDGVSPTWDGFANSFLWGGRLQRKMSETGGAERPLASRAKLFVVFLICGMSVVALAVSGNVVLELGTQLLAAIFLIVAVLLRRSPTHRDLWETFFAFFLLAFVFLTRFVLGALAAQVAPADTLAGEILVPIALFAAVVLPIVLLTKASGAPLSSLYLRRGNLRSGVLAGGLAFVVLYVGAIVGFLLAFGASRGVTLGQLLSLTPAVLYLAAWNAPNEELWFRGLFLKRWEPHVGKRGALLLQAPMFALGHYVPEFTRFGPVFVIAFLALAFLAALGFGYLMQRTDSLLGSTLAHIGADVSIYLPVLLGITTAGIGGV